MLGYFVWSSGERRCIREIAEWIATGDHAKWLACINPHSYWTACKSPRVAAALRDADWLVPDGIGIVGASLLLGGRIRARVTGTDVFHGVNGVLRSRGGARVFVLGSTDDALRAIERNLSLDYPGVHVIGTYSPPFKPEYTDGEVESMIAAINAAAADVLWVGMTAPKQELWIARARPHLEVKFIAAVGAVLDFYSGRAKRSSRLAQRLGLEWLPRLVREPRRLWRRMAVSAPMFIWHVLRARVTLAVVTSPRVRQ